MSYVRYNNIVKDYNTYQGLIHPTDAKISLRSLDVRRILLENTSESSVLVEISNYDSKFFNMFPGESKFVAINPIGEGDQMIAIRHPVTRQLISQPTPLSSDANQFIIRDGLNIMMVHKYHMPSFNPAH